MDLDELERLHREATPGPWRCVEHSYGGCKVTNEEGDAILLEDDFRLIAAMRNALPKLISRARLYEQMDRHACDQVAEIDRLRVRIAEADRDRDTWATSAHKIANERDAAARDLAAVTAERDALKKHYDEAAPEHNLLALLDMYHEQERTAVAERDAECERLEGLRRRDNASMRARLAEVDHERDALAAEHETILKRLAEIESIAEEIHVDRDEKRKRLLALESLAEDARTCAEWCKHMDVGSGAETGAAARRVLAGIGGK